MTRYDPSAGNSRQGDPFAAEQRAVNADLVALRQQNQCLLGQLVTVRDGSNAHAANLSKLATENVELHTINARYKAALEQYAADENWAYFVSDDSFSWQRDEHPATVAARALHEEEE